MRLLLSILTVSLCTSFKFSVFNAKTTRMTKLADQQSISALAPDTGTAVDYVKNSRKAAASFVDYDSENCESYVNITLISKSKFKEWSSNISIGTLEFLETIGQSMKTFPGGKTVSLPVTANLSIVSMLAFYDDSDIPSKFSHKAFDGLWSGLKNKTYHFKGTDDAELGENISTKLATSWALSTYRFQYYKSKPVAPNNANATIVWPYECDRASVLTLARAYSLMKDLVDSPALSLGPQELAAAAVAVGIETNASFIKAVVGVNELINENYPQIAAVGMAAGLGREPRIIDIRWDAPILTKEDIKVENEGLIDRVSKEIVLEKKIPEIVIIGKGITFDTGGLNIKGGGGMRNMKKDMAGSAQAISLALWIVESKLPVKLRLLLPIAENSISGNALRPGDVIKARNGKTTEITNTDAEGRLVLADAMVAAVESPNSPCLVVDFATLTGAARVALGNDLPAVFSNNIDALQRLWNISNIHNDPVWMMPLYEPMRSQIKSSVADLVNAADGFGGAITAALYLSEFLDPVKPKKSEEKDGKDEMNDKEILSNTDDKDKIDSNVGTFSRLGLRSTEMESGLTVSTSDTGDGLNENEAAKSSMVWFHVDFMGSKGGNAEPQGMRAVYEYIKSEYVK